MVNTHRLTHAPSFKLFCLWPLGIEGLYRDQVVVAMNIFIREIQIMSHIQRDRFNVCCKLQYS